MINYETRTIENPISGYEMITREVIKDYINSKSYNKLAIICGIFEEDAIEAAITYSSLQKAINRLKGESIDTTNEENELKSLLNDLTIKACEKDEFIKNNGIKAFMNEQDIKASTR